LAKGSKPNQRSSNVNFWGMIRDVMIQAINKGVVIPAALALVLIIIAVKVPGEDATEILKNLIAGMRSGSVIGYLLAGAAVGGWAAHAKRLRRELSEEMKRVGREKSELHNIIIGKNLVKSSEGRGGKK